MINFYLDIETDNSEGYGLDPYLTRIVTIQILLPDGKVCLKKDPKNIDDIRMILEKGQIVGANIKFDAKVIEAQFGVQIKHMYDVQIAELVISGGNKARTKGAVTYKALVKQYCCVEIDKEEQTTFRHGMPLTPAQKEYAYNDIKHLPEIYEKQQKEIKKLGLEDIIKTEMDCIPAMVWLELSGLLLDVNILHEFEKEYYKIRATALQRVFSNLKKEINLNSPQQVKKALQEYGIPVESTSKKYLIQFSEHEVVRAILEFKQMEKLFSAFVNKLPKMVHPTTGRIHADFRQFGARSGRMSCTNPNLQQQPANDVEIKDENGEVVQTLVWRKIYRARPGYKIVTADYDQMELRILTEASREPKFIQAFNQGLDLHLMTAEMVNHTKIDKTTEEGKKKRKAAKKVNFGIPYGVSKYGLMNQLHSELIPCTLEEAAGMLAAHRAGYPVLHKYLDRMQNEAKSALKIRNLAGRLICYSDPLEILKQEDMRRKANKEKPAKAKTKPPLPLEQYKKKLYQQIGNNGKNNPIQSLGVDILKIALKGIYDRLNEGPVDQHRKQVYLVNIIHDEIVLECPEDMAEYVASVVKEEMEAAGKRFIKVIDCPVKPEIADYWKK